MSSVIYSKIGAFQRHMNRNPLLINSVLLMLSTGTVAFFGFLFWVIVAHKYHSDTIGLATSILSSGTLLGQLSLVGLDTVIIRFLPTTDDEEKFIDTAIIVVGSVAIATSVLFFAVIHLYLPSYSYTTQNIFNTLTIAAFILFSAWNVLTNAIFIAYRQVFCIFVINVAFSLVKVLLPFGYSHGDAIHLVLMSAIAQGVNVILSLSFLYKLKGYYPKLKFTSSTLAHAKSYTFHSYIASILNLLPPTLMPVLITQQLGSAQAAYYYIAYTIASLLYTVVYSVMQTVFSESSHNEHALLDTLKNGIKTSLLFMAPLIMILSVGSNYILRIFGQEYGMQASWLLIILSLNGLLVIPFSALGTYFKVQKMTRSLVKMNLFFAVTVVLVFSCISHTMGLSSIGIAWVCGYVISVLSGTGDLYKNIKITRLSQHDG